jgi:hypothetical protein
MIITVILVLVGFLSLAAILFLAKGRAQPPTSLGNLRKQMHSLDIEAFRNLIDSRDEEFLRRTLEPPLFRVVQRARLLAAVEYIGCASRNAAILHRFGEAARHSLNPSVAEAGNKLVNSAIRFRLNALHSIVKLYLAILMPGTSVRKVRIVEGYERMTALVALLGCLQFERRAAYASAAPQLSA